MAKNGSELGFVCLCNTWESRVQSVLSYLGCLAGHLAKHRALRFADAT